MRYGSDLMKHGKKNFIEGLQNMMLYPVDH